MSDENTNEKRIRHINEGTYQLAKEVVRKKYGTFYAHIGEYITDALKYYMEHNDGVKKFEDINNSISFSNSLRPKTSKTKRILIKQLELLLDMDEDDTYTKTLLFRKVREVRMSGGDPPANQTVYNDINNLEAYRIIIKQPDGSFKISSKKAKELLQSLDSGLKEGDEEKLIPLIKNRFNDF